ncbi:MAG: xanthine dehydrogenase family protein molybdopterin-binding subunit [Candidatus Eremiobacteraeota bacterium]|nr:xanthine dehydrogenase family protein molybdopterin-binding subunit [Candidatus Eremiobacteraeota bacterium]
MTALARREFLQLTSALAAALIVPVGCSGNSSSNSGADFTPNQWVAIHPNGNVTVFSAKSEMGQGTATAMATLVADELDVPLSVVTVEFGSGQLYLDPVLKTQVTGGSTSVEDMYLPMRRAGATARAMLVAAAAQNWNIDATTCQTQNATVTGPGGKSATYASLIDAARRQTVPQDVTLKPNAQFNLIGKTSPRIDLMPKVTGKAGYGIDVRVPGMHFASIERAPRFGATVQSFDASKAKQVPGVLDVVQVPNGVAVVATNTYAAFTGRSALNVVWSAGNTQLDSDKLFTEREALARSKKGAIVDVNVGNVDTAKGRAFEAVYRTPYLAHAAMEPMNATAHVTSSGVEVWAPTQNQSNARLVAAKAAGVSQDAVTVHTTYLGGGFGRRLENDYVGDAVSVSKAIGAPVQVIWQRTDDIPHDYFRPLSVNLLRGVTDAHGNIISIEHIAVAEPCSTDLFGPYPHGLDYYQLQGINNVEYELPNYRGVYIPVYVGIPTTTMRAPGANQNTFALESFIDEMAAAGGKDPLTVRLGLFSKNSRAQHVLRTAAQRAGWGHAKTPGAKQGLAFAYWEHTATAVIAEVTMNGSTPVVHHLTIVADPGLVINPDIVLQQLEGGANFGLSMAMIGNITIKGGAVQQHNFDTYRVLQLAQAPTIDASFITNEERPTGMGEVGVPPTAPAVGNAVFALTGKRVRSLPFVS